VPSALAVLALLAIVEFSADKTTALVRISDVLHTFARPLAGALILSGTDTWLSQQAPMLAAVLGALLALTIHAIKVGMRHARTMLWGSADNPIVSTAEDVLVVMVLLALLLSPLVRLLLVAAGTVLCYTLPRLWRRYCALVRRRRARARGLRSGQVASAGAGAAPAALGQIAYQAPSMPAISQAPGTVSPSLARSAYPAYPAYPAHPVYSMRHVQAPPASPRHVAPAVAAPSAAGAVARAVQPLPPLAHRAASADASSMAPRWLQDLQWPR